MNEETKIEQKEEAVETTEKEETPKVEETASDTPVIKEVDVILPISQETITIHKLKAGRYYEAQKLFTKWVTSLQVVLETSDYSAEKFRDADGQLKVDELKAATAKQTSEKLDEVLEASSKSQEIMIELISVCLGKPMKEVIEEYYSEDLEAISKAAMSLNGFAENLKKSVALSAEQRA